MNLTCRFASAQPVELPSWLTEDGASTIAGIYAAASGAAIELDVDTLDVGVPLTDTRDDLTSYDLHYALRSFLGSGAVPLDTIAVLLARRYSSARIFGIMFDTEFARHVPNPSAAQIAGRPREGCAVFLQEIYDRRPDRADAEAQSFFTTVHELGHLFNLPHYNAAPCYMCESGETTYGSSYFRFVDHQKAHLSLAHPDETFVWPGGSRFGDRRNFDGAQPPNMRRPSPLQVVLSIARDHFHHFEPVELDVEIALGKGRARAAHIPDRVDPGYEAFRIWIEEPNGERRLYRSPRHYCWSGAMRRIARDVPFRRDISLFGESGGFTFRRRGMHRVWAELDIPGCAPTISNTVAFEVDAILTKRAAAEARLFSTTAVKTVLYHRLDRHHGAGIRMLREWLSLQRGHSAAPSVRYAVARALLEKCARSRGRQSLELGKTARALLKRAIDAVCLGTNQRRIAERLTSTET